MKADPWWWHRNPRSLWYGGPVVVGVCVVLLLIAFCILYRHGQTENEIVAKLLSKDPNGSFDVDHLPTWVNSVRGRIGIPNPVTDVILHGSQITDADLASLGGFSHLRSLSFDQCAITDEGVKWISRLRTLEHLSLGACPTITDTSLAYLRSLKSLASLNLYAPGKRISSCNICCLSALPKLDILAVADCDGISDDAVEALASLKRLRNLDIRGTSISDEGTKRLALALPETLIIADTQESLPVPKRLYPRRSEGTGPVLTR
jgi:hypothetical protein